MQRPLGEWQYQSPRDELSLRHEAPVADPMRARLRLSGTGDIHAIGSWRSEASLEAGRWYRATVGVEYHDVDHPALSLYAEAAGRFLLPREGWQSPAVLEHTFRHDRPETGGAFELFLKASAHGKVEWIEPRIEEVDAPKPRMVRVATIHFVDPGVLLTMEEQRLRIARHLDEAGVVKPDVVVLSEFAPLLHVPPENYGSLSDAAETVPDGPTCRILSQSAKRFNTYIIAGIIERRGQHVFNTTVIFGRDGAFVGRYDKTHLTFPEVRNGISPGASYPLLDLDFGRVGILTCADEWYPEVARYYAHRGAEMLFLPVLGGKPIVWRTRALDNRVYFVTAAHQPPSMIIDSTGAILAEHHGEGNAVADLDLSLRKVNWYMDPHLSDGMPSIFPEARHVLNDDLLHELYASMLTGAKG